ncbi:MAG TPA: glycosyltransferase family 9 protein [Opitutaceae bacterium]|nr:glycosyltransferase family 9 protein [Opitutaceae bacterium]
MIKIFLQVLGWLIAHTPEPLLDGLCGLLGRLMLLVAARRRRLVYSNLDHAFPDRSRDWKRKIARESSRRLFETVLISAAAPYLSEKRIRSMVTAAPEIAKFFGEHQAAPFPMLICVPHFAYWETLTWLSLFVPQPPPQFGVIFRPLNNSTLDAWVKRTRERFGMRLLSRKTGLQEAFKFLKSNSAVALLFDQNAGMNGALTTLFGRVCSTTELTDLLARKYQARASVCYPRRLGFWRLRFEDPEIPSAPAGANVALEANRWLETALSSDDNLCASWLWSHDRWRNQDMPDRRFRLEAKRDLLTEDLAAHGLAELPRRTRFWIRLPNWLGDVVMALPLLRALRASRPDAEITLIGKAVFLPFLKMTGVADRLEALPSRENGYFRSFWRMRHQFPDTYVLFTHSFRGDLEAWLTRARQRFGVVWPGKHRPLLTHRYDVPADFVEAERHQFEVWQNYFRRFGLVKEIERTPLRLDLPAAPNDASRSGNSTTTVLPHANDVVFGFIAGSENTPEKRWPIEHWRTLIQALAAVYPQAQFKLFGTKNDQPITSSIASGLGAKVEDIAGKTDLPRYIEELRRCTILVTNDTGGMHLANSCGVPLIALFGPTNPIRTGPIYSAPFEILQPPGCPRTGGGKLVDLRPETVLASVRRLVPAAAIRE